MAFFKYLCSAPVAQVGRAVLEYARLCKNERKVRRGSILAYDALVVDLGMQEYDMTLMTDGCIVTCARVYRTAGPDGETAVRLCRSKCDRFHWSLPCSNYDCKYHARNMKYFQTENAYQIAKNMRKNFWTKKLQSVKER